jgi:transketolase N-terminal domain/subunit
VPRSLLESADLGLLRTLGADGGAMATAAALVDTGLLQFDPADPEWADRDRLVVAGERCSAAVRRRLEEAGAAADRAGIFAASGGDAMALAFGAAMAARLDGNVWRAWCLLDDDACDDGRVWEVARAAADSGSEGLGVVVVGDGSSRLWGACGWPVHEVPAGDPVWLLGALDQVGARSPAVVVVAADG